MICLAIDEKGTKPKWCYQKCRGCEFAHYTIEERAKMSGFASVKEWAHALVELLKRE